MHDLTPLIGQILSSPWLLPLLTLAVVADGFFPFLPSEPLLFSAAATAAAKGDTTGVAALFVAVLIGSFLGDLLLYGAGRSSHRILRTTRRDEGIGAWVRRHLHRRPVVALAAVRLVPGGRLASVTAAGRVRLPPTRLVPAVVVSSLLWTSYMTGVGLLIGPVTGGDPMLSLLAGLASATIIGGTLEGTRRIIRQVRRVRTPRRHAWSRRQPTHTRDAMWTSWSRSRTR